MVNGKSFYSIVIVLRGAVHIISKGLELRVLPVVTRRAEAVVLGNAEHKAVIAFVYCALSAVAVPSSCSLLLYATITSATTT